VRRKAKKGGRPSAFKPEFPDLARKFCLLGATNEDLARLLDVGITTIDRWLAEKPQFRGAVKQGREAADANVAESLYRRACGYSHPAVKIHWDKDGREYRADYTEHYPPDTAAAFIWLKNRRKEQWRDKAEVEVTHRHDAGSLTDEELAEIVSGRRRDRAAPAPDDPERLH
jgi:hypothetical protein